MFIVLEGAEGAGKSTQADLLVEWFRERELPFDLAREPGGTPVGEAIRRVVLDKGNLTMPPETELFLMLGARAAFVRDLVVPALEDGKILLADRYDFSTFAYQGFGRGLELNEVRRANQLATGGLKPDLYLVLDLPVNLGLERKSGGEVADRIEREGSDFLARVREGYQDLVRTEPSARLIEASGSPEAVQSSIRTVLEETFPETFSATRV